MAETTIRTTLECSGQDYFEKCLFADGYAEKLFVTTLKFPGVKVLELDRAGATWKRRVHIDPPMTGLPGPVAKLIGDSFSYVEEGTYDPKTQRYTFKVTPSTAADKTKTTGESWVESSGGKTVLCTRLNVEVKIFMVGGMVEDKIMKDFRGSFETAAPFINAFAKGG
jgi:Protein of unknown function (DUF2505)